MPASPIGYGEELTGCSTTPDGTLVLVGNEFRPHAEKLAVVWKRTAAGTWSSAVPASEAHPVASAGTTCTLGGVSYELVSEITTAPYESVRARREQYARDLDTQTLQRML